MFKKVVTTEMNCFLTSRSSLTQTYG